VFQTPKANDAAVRKELGHIEEMIVCVENAAKMMPIEGITDVHSIAAAYLVQLQLLIE
jgi:hypothetical protein